MKIDIISSDGIHASEKDALVRMRQAFNASEFSLKWQGYAWLHADGNDLPGSGRCRAHLGAPATGRPWAPFVQEEYITTLVLYKLKRFGVGERLQIPEPRSHLVIVVTTVGVEQTVIAPSALDTTARLADALRFNRRGVRATGIVESSQPTSHFLRLLRPPSLITKFVSQGPAPRSPLLVHTSSSDASSDRRTFGDLPAEAVLTSFDVLMSMRFGDHPSLPVFSSQPTNSCLAHCCQGAVLRVKTLQRSG